MSSENRDNNLRLCTAALDGYVIKAGEEFSFNKAVGPRTEAKGYEEAHIFVGDEEVDEIGGGICQVASTLYNAALEAKLKILERNQHGKEVYYVELGKDATVFYGQLDMRFKNTTNDNIKIKAGVSDKKVSVELVTAA